MKSSSPEPTPGSNAARASPVLAGFATGMVWTLLTATGVSVLLFPLLWIFAIVPGPTIGLLVGLWRASHVAARTGGSPLQRAQAALAVLAGISAAVVPIVGWLIFVR